MSKSSPPNEVLKILERPNATTIEVLKCSDLTSVYRTSDPKLMSFLLEPSHIREIFDILMKTGARSDHKRIMTLYQGNNTSLHRVFGDSIPLTEYAFQPLQRGDDKSSYASGTISRCFARALDLWPDEIYDVFHFSNVLYKIVIDNIDKSVVYMTISGIINDTIPIYEFFWYLFNALTGKVSPTDRWSTPPRCCYLSKPLENVAKLDTKPKIQNAINLLSQFFNLKQPILEDFAEYVLDYITSITSKNDFSYHYYQLAKTCGYSESLRNIAMQTVKTAASTSGQLNTPLVTAAVGYLEICSNFFDQQTAESLIATLLDKDSNQFTLISLVVIAKEICAQQDYDWVEKFKENMKKIIACAWNHYHHLPLMVSILFDLSISLHLEENKSGKGYENNIKDWKRNELFLSSVEPDERQMTFDTEVTFDEDAYNIEEMNRLRWGAPF